MWDSGQAARPRNPVSKDTKRGSSEDDRARYAMNKVLSEPQRRVSCWFFPGLYTWSCYLRRAM